MTNPKPPWLALLANFGKPLFFWPGAWQTWFQSVRGPVWATESPFWEQWKCPNCVLIAIQLSQSVVSLFCFDRKKKKMTKIGMFFSDGRKNKMKPTNPNADTYVEKEGLNTYVSQFPANPFVEHPDLTHWGNTLVGHHTIALHSGKTLLLDTLIWHSCGTLLLDTLLRHSYLTLL